MAYSKKEREQYTARREAICEELGITIINYNYLRRIGNTLQRIYVDRCNGDIKEDTYEALTLPLYTKADTYASGLGLYLFYQTDPRGATIYADKKPIPENNYTIARCIY